MKLSVETEVILNHEKPFKCYEELEIVQELSEHHHLTLKCRADDIIPSKKRDLTDGVGFIKKYIGKSIAVKTTYDNDKNKREIKKYGNELEFHGVILNIDDSWEENGADGYEVITIYARSNTILMDGTPSHKSYYQKPLKDILTRTLEPYKGKNTTFDVKNLHNYGSNKTILYSVQDGCTDFEYMKRLAAYYGQWFYSTDGKTIIVGNPDTKIINLEYRSNLSMMKLKMQPIPNKGEYITYDYRAKTNEIHKKTSTPGIKSHISEEAKKVFPNSSIVDYVSPEQDENTFNSNFESQIERNARAKETNQVILNGQSVNLKVSLGKKIKITETYTAKDGAKKTRDHGVYFVTKVTHTSEGQGNYQNTFEAIQANTMVSPLADLTQIAKSYSQVATVSDNKDPEGLGRVQVQMLWQKAATNKTHTPWIRVLTRHAGLNRGAYCIPEIGDEVIVDFQGGNAEAPYVVGTLYNARETPDKEWASKENVDKNNIKAIRTRSGHTILFNDKKGEEKIEIYDKEDNMIIFDTKKKSIHIQAKETISIKAKNIMIDAEEDIKMSAKKDMQSIAEGKLALQSKADMSLKSDANLTTEADKKIALKSKEIDAKGSSKVNVGGGKTTIKGSKVYIN